jgi:photosystem II stability/assembly factor-like uncharacterized protein
VPGGLFDATAIVCTSSVHCVATVATSKGLGAGAVLATFDGGAKWGTFVPPQQQQTETSMNSVPELTSLTCATPTACLAGGLYPSGGMNSGYRAVIRSVDGGSTWSAVLTTAIPGDRAQGDSFISAVQCSADGTCIAIDNGSASAVSSIITSTDGGQTWVGRAMPRLSPFVPSSLSCVSATRCWAIGAIGPLPKVPSGPVRIVATSNGWRTMTVQRTAR